MKKLYFLVLMIIYIWIFVGCNNSVQEQKHLEVNASSSSVTSSITEASSYTETESSAEASKVVIPSKSSITPAKSTQKPEKQAEKEKKEEKEKQDKPLSGFTVCVDAGHGKTSGRNSQKEPVAPASKIMKAAYASGTVGVFTKISEESLNLTVSKKLKTALSDLGANVIMIRETSQCDLSNIDRAELWNASGADLTIRIHGNGSDNSKASGVLMMVPGDKYIKDKDMLKKSEMAGQIILDKVIEKTGAKSQGMVKSTELTGFNWSTIPVVLLEMGFMTNVEEDKLLNTDEYQNKIVKGIVEGLLKYFNSEYST